MQVWGLTLITYAPGGAGWGSSLLYISIAYNMQKWGEGVQIACKNAYVINGRPLSMVFTDGWQHPDSTTQSADCDVSVTYLS